MHFGSLYYYNYDNIYASLYNTHVQGPPPKKRSRLAELSTDVASTASPSSASKLNAKFSELSLCSR